MKDMGAAGGGVCGLLEDGVKNSEGEKLSGLPWCEEPRVGESLGLDRTFEDAFLRTGRIQGGRDINAGPIS